MESLRVWLRTLTFADLADFLSVIGFCLTVYLLFTIRKIKNYYVFKVRVPDLLKVMAKQASTLAQLHQAFDESKLAILLEIGKAEVTLRSLSPKVDRSIRASINEGIWNMDHYPPFPTKTRVWDIYVGMQKVSQQIINLQEDRRAGDN